MSNLAYIETPEPQPKTVKKLGDFLELSGQWHQQHFKSAEGMLSDLWYRGVNTHFDAQAPGIFRQRFTDRARSVRQKGDVDAKRLRLEREVISQFRSGGAAFLDGFNRTQIYFLAQHFGMPTQLLDWSTNPLAALFFACQGESKADGCVYAMDAKLIIPADAMRSSKKKLYQSVMTMRHALVEYAIGLSFWEGASPDDNNIPHVLPVRPDAMPGRVGQQSSCFTLHMHGAGPASNPTMITIKVDADSKTQVLQELHRVNINQFTTYHDLDYLSKEIKRAWGL